MKKYFTVVSHIHPTSTVVCTFSSPEGSSYRMFGSVEAALNTPGENSTNLGAQCHREWATMTTQVERSLNTSWIEVSEEQLRACLSEIPEPTLPSWYWNSDNVFPYGMGNPYPFPQGAPVRWTSINPAYGGPCEQEPTQVSPKTNHRIGVPKNKLP